MIYVDTREKKWRHLKRFFKANGIKFSQKALETGDYMSDEAPGITIDRKGSLDEVAGNLITRDKDRFMREVRRAFKAGLRLIIMIETEPEIKTMSDVEKWHSAYSRISGRYLVRQMMFVSNGYKVEWILTDKEHSPGQIASLLGQEIRQHPDREGADADE